MPLPGGRSRLAFAALQGQLEAELHKAFDGAVRLERLGPGMCSWPLGATGEDRFYFCGAATVPGKPYCPTHCNLAYVPAAKNRRGAAVA